MRQIIQAISLSPSRCSRNSADISRSRERNPPLYALRVMILPCLRVCVRLLTYSTAQEKNRKAINSAGLVDFFGLFCTTYLVGTIGLEPTTPWMSTKCSNQLSYAPIAGFALYPKAYRASNENRAQF